MLIPRHYEDLTVLHENTAPCRAYYVPAAARLADPVYTREELEQKGHNYELVPCGSTVLCIDYRQNGLGSTSCGTVLLPEYRFDENEFRFQVTLTPTTE